MTEDYEDQEEPRKPRTVYWTGRQWCVTDFGLETVVDHRYDIGAGQLGHLTMRGGEELDMAERFRHTASHGWVDVEDFAAAFAVAIAVHAGKFTPLPEGAFLNALADCRRARWISKFEAMQESSGSWAADFQAAGDAANAREAEMPFSQVPDPDPGYAAGRAIIEREAEGVD